MTVVIAVPFAKTEAHGNDFLLVAREELGLTLEEGDVERLARSICDRLRGVGGDGLILYRARGDEFEMTLVNSDGSHAEISGNGLRCLGSYLVHRSLTEEPTFFVQTGAGRLSLTLIEHRGRRFRFRADMGKPRLAARDVPFLADDAEAPAVSAWLDVEGERFAVTAVSMGNPHCVLFTDAFDREELLRIGPRIESHPRFPNKTNVELVQVLGKHEVRMGIWERGAGETASSGTGSAASAVASILNGLAESPVEVLTPGGTISVEWRSGESVLVTGDASVVAEGRYLYDGRET